VTVDVFAPELSRSLPPKALGTCTKFLTEKNSTRKKKRYMGVEICTPSGMENEVLLEMHAISKSRSLWSLVSDCGRFCP
jgi:hypothetical protein